MNEKIEEIIIRNFNPDFFMIDHIDKSNINLVISSKCFINQSVPDRISSVYRTLEKEYPDLFDIKGIFVATLTLDEMTDSLDFFLQEQNEKNE